jgi:UDP-3-O-[3-hydroxymyristoyl] glucosamine N-acyltransferase
MVGGQVGFAGHIKIANGTKIGAQAGLLSEIKEENTAIIGSPAFDIRQFMKSSVLFKRLPDMKVKLDTVAKEVEALKNR